MEFNDGIIDKVIGAISDALIEGAEVIAEESKAQVPKNTGELRDSCKVEILDSKTVTVGYDAPYAVVVHEDLEQRHENGKAKYLEDPFNESAENIVSDAAQNIKKVI